MSDFHVEGMDVASNVVETIVSIAATSVDGVASVGPAAASGLRSIFGGKPSTQGVEVEVDESDILRVTVHVTAQYGYVLPDLAAKVREAIADAVSMQVGATVGSVDVYIDSIQFER